MPTFTVDTDERLTVVDVTDRVRAALPENADGTATVFVRHTTAAITVNEAEPRLLDDLSTALGDLVPDEGWEHDARGGGAATSEEAGAAGLPLDGNADAHVRAMLVGPSETVPVTAGDLDLGTWQSMLLVECDGPRERTVDVRID